MGPTQGFARLSSGKYLALIENSSGNTSATNVVLFDPQLNEISQAQLPVDFGGVGVFADFNGDGTLDIVGATTTYNGKEDSATTTIQILVGDGGANFHPGASFSLSGNYFGVVAAVADLNGDHKLDLITNLQLPFFSVTATEHFRRRR
jgi:hypothetical protein